MYKVPATLELEMNKDIFKWNLEQMKNKEIEENNERKEGCDVDYTPIYQLADTLWSKLQKEAKLGVFKDFNKPGMEHFYKGLSYLLVVKDSECYWNATFNRCDELKSISDFFESRDKKLERNFSFLYDSVEVNQQKLQARLDLAFKERDDMRQANECYKVFLSTKEYQEARAIVIQKNARAKELEHRISRAKALEEYMSEKLANYLNRAYGSIFWNRYDGKNDLAFDKCIGLSDKTKDDENDETQDSKESLLSGRYAELFDEKYYENKSNDWYSPKVKPEIYENALYKELTWCAIKDRYNDVSKEIYEYKSGLYKAVGIGRYNGVPNLYVKDTGIDATAGKIETVAEELYDRKWKAMAEKYPYVDYESAIENPWYKDKAKRKSFDVMLRKTSHQYLKITKRSMSNVRTKCLKAVSENVRKS
ncbi:hypothetical protein LS74_003265 [Helicobacter magdeburgensis]|uniref:Uncharacterized protein n=2 Tax=Helicobacter magdeburgensis TaxID=471858 RepID=A0A4U8T1K2_9HELI|nr:hypothetical protein LS74_003265 [Helicobacter magdeburgensis]